MTDEELIEKIRKGSEDAEIELLARYKELVIKISRGYFIVGADLEDLIQEGMIGLYQAIKNYSPSKDAKFKTFAVVCIKHQIHNAIKKANSGKNKLLSSAISFQNLTSDDDDFYPIGLVLDETPAIKAIEKENLKNLNETIRSTLSSLEYKILRLYLQGYSYKEISKKLNLPQKTIDNGLSRIRSKLRTKLKNPSQAV